MQLSRLEISVRVVQHKSSIRGSLVGVLSRVSRVSFILLGIGLWRDLVGLPGGALGRVACYAQLEHPELVSSFAANEMQSKAP